MDVNSFPEGKDINPMNGRAKAAPALEHVPEILQKLIEVDAKVTWLVMALASRRIDPTEGILRTQPRKDMLIATSECGSWQDAMDCG